MAQRKSSFRRFCFCRKARFGAFPRADVVSERAADARAPRIVAIVVAHKFAADEIADGHVTYGRARSACKAHSLRVAGDAVAQRSAATAPRGHAAARHSRQRLRHISARMHPSSYTVADEISGERGGKAIAVASPAEYARRRAMHATTATNAQRECAVARRRDYGARHANPSPARASLASHTRKSIDRTIRESTPQKHCDAAASIASRPAL